MSTQPASRRLLGYLDATRREWFPLAEGPLGHAWWLFAVGARTIGWLQGHSYGATLAWWGLVGLVIGAMQVHGRHMGPWWWLALGLSLIHM